MKILFLCHANMCRSPLAEGLLRLIFKEKNIKAVVDSAGFEAYHINESPDERAIQQAKKNGIDISTKKVRLFTKDDFDVFDKIYVMDNLAYRNAVYYARNENDKRKVDYLMNVIKPDTNESVPDPFYRNLEACDETYNILKAACEKIAEGMSKEVLN
ncbi:MAG: low molecular weight phosphotyrosine protein phosphatase [Bacteroidales bacterium]|nr:low molecular weight phosphotyrosine protein phosphatase [Bacteroidales bacterium]MCF8405034.1 low molecular weight phosphotyrosine protein phosphatase [Bacteroidales bacterium]